MFCDFVERWPSATQAKWLGISLTKRKFAELVGRVIPFVGGAVAGGLTWAVFGGSAKRLRK